MVDETPYTFSKVFPENRSLVFKPTLFNSPSYIDLFYDGIKSFYLVASAGKNIHCQIHFLIDSGIAHSLPQSLFGGIESSKQVDMESLNQYFKLVVHELMKEKIEEISIMIPAEFYGAMNYKFYEAHGFKIKTQFKNHHIPVTEKKYAQMIHRMEQRRLKKNRQNKVIVKQLHSENLKEVYMFIQACREEKKTPMSVTFDKLYKSFHYFPDHYLLFAAYLEDRIISATVAVKTKYNILYNFLPGSLAEYNKLSPAILINEYIYDYCRDRQIDLIDYGISTLPDGTDQDSLITFKERAGGIPGYKYLLVKKR